MMDKVRIWHNPRCSKSRQTLALIKEQGVEPEIRLYLDNPPSVQEISAVLTALKIEPRDLMRVGETLYRELQLGKSTLDRGALIDAMASHPILIERPVVIVGKRAALGRPPENVLALLK